MEIIDTYIFLNPAPWRNHYTAPYPNNLNRQAADEHPYHRKKDDAVKNRLLLLFEHFVGYILLRSFLEDKLETL